MYRSILLFLAVVVTGACLVSCSTSVTGGGQDNFTVRILSPDDGDTVSDGVVVEIDIAGEIAVEVAVLYIDGDSTAADSTAPYSFVWQTATLEDSTYHTIWAAAVDTADSFYYSDTVTVLVTVPAGFTFVSAIVTQGDATVVAYDSTTATLFIGDGPNGILSYDVSNPTDPAYLGRYVISGTVLGLTVQGQVLYAALGDPGIHSIDVSDPANLAFLGLYDSPGVAYHVSVSNSGRYLYISDGDAVQVVDAETPSLLVPIYHFDLVGSAIESVIDGEVLYVATGDGVQVLAISNEIILYQLGSITTNGFARSLTVHGDVLYVADSGEGLQLIDISNPAAPQMLGRYQSPGETYSVIWVQDMVLAADRDNGIIALDVAEPAVPYVLYQFDTSGSSYDLVYAGELLFVADRETASLFRFNP